ncbi:MAG: Crp/Fnr family transcriptional regulator [Hyphomicrobiaceae bacterium]
MTRLVDWSALTGISPLLAALPLEARSGTRTLELDVSEYVFRSQDRPAAMFFIASGAVKLVRRSMSGDAIVLQRNSGGFLAEASLDQPAYHCDAVVVSQSRMLAIPLISFRAALDDAGFRQGWMSHLARELRRVRAQAERLGLRSAQERILHYIEVEGIGGSVVLDRSKKDWASELGISHEALYRTLARMERGGEIHIDGMIVSRLTSTLKHGRAT